MDGRTDGWINEQMDGRMNGDVNGWMDGQMDRQAHVRVHTLHNLSHLKICKTVI